LLTLTCYTRKELASKILNLTAWKWHKRVAFEKVKDTLTKKVCDNANMVAKVKTVTQVNALISVRFII
jgi:hypothetical protein